LSWNNQKPMMRNRSEKRNGCVASMIAPARTPVLFPALT
jgi:hypothetical protein